MKKKIQHFLLCSSLIGKLIGQQQTFYTLSDDSVILNFSAPTILIFYSDHSCFDCFVKIHDHLMNKTQFTYYFIIEKNGSAMNNFNTFSNLANNKIPKTRLLFTKNLTHQISPFIQIRSGKNVLFIPYEEIFVDKESLDLSDSTARLLGAR